MISKEKVNNLLSDIRELEQLVVSMQHAEDVSIRVLAQTGNLTFMLLEKIKQLEAEEIRKMSQRMAEQQEELMRLTALFEQYKQAAGVCKEDIRQIEVEQAVEEEYQEEEKTVPTDEKPTEMKVEVPSVSWEEEVVVPEVSSKRELPDVRRAFSLNDRFRFRRELFGGRDEEMNRLIERLNQTDTYEEAMTLISAQGWDIEQECVADFIKLLEKRFI